MALANGLLSRNRSHAIEQVWHLQLRIFSIMTDTVSYIDATEGHNADSPTLMPPSGAITGVHTFLLERRIYTSSENVALGFCFAISIQLLHLGPTVFHLAAG